MERKALAIANNDIVYLWWTYSEKIPNCLGFTIRRILKNKAPVALPAFVGFKPKKKNDQPPIKYPTTDYWPIQSYQWKDLFVPEETEVGYEIAPVTGTPDEKLKEIQGLAIRTNSTKATDTIGRYRVVFNRGILSTQSLAKKLPKGKTGTPSAGALRKHIATVGDKIRMNLSGEAITALTSLLDRACNEGGRCYCALYELTDPELIAALQESKGHVEVILSNADSSEEDDEGKSKKVYDGTNKDSRKKLRKALGNALHDRLLAKGSYIGHNKFVVYVDKGNQPRAVLTGSTNWTPTGLCAQSNNILLIEDSKIAFQYLNYWQRLRDDEAEQSPDFRKENATALPTLNMGANQGNVHVWFTPDTAKKTKPKNNPPTPPDMAEVFEAIRSAEHGALFLLFSAGAPSILQQLTEVSRLRSEQKKPFFVRGAISDAKTANQFKTRVYNDSLLQAPNTLITGVAGIPDQFSYWEKELAKLGHAVIHDKILVIDPFGSKCVVVTGSHNLGFKASYSNDENFCIIRGNRAVAEAYTAHILDVVNHYNWRYKLWENKKKGEGFKTAFTDLYETDRWQDKYFKGGFLKNRDLFFFAGSD